MGLTSLIKNYADYNAWANTRLSNYLRTKPRELITQEAVSSFLSIAMTVWHFLDSQEFWITVIAGTRFDDDKWNKRKPDAEEVISLLIENSNMFREYVVHLSEEDLVRPVQTPWIENKLPVYEVIQHCLNHSSYHRGQVTTILRQLGIKDIPLFDYYEYLKLNAGEH
ncbi:MAG TPA: DinB family protein [Cyclobacteriaceae bacterium]|nr:DinB family protein [Cyclobacteriaceae bacterium]